MKVAILCSGLGRVQRGFERLMSDLAGILREDCEVTVFKGGGTEAPGEKVVWNLPRHGRSSRLFAPLYRMVNRTAYHAECISFALAVAPHLLRGRFDVVHFIDQPMGRILARLRRLMRAKFRILYTNGAVMDVRYYPPCDHVHQIAQVLQDAAFAAGIPAAKSTLLPCGIHPSRFAIPETREALRARHGIEPGRFVALSVCAINRVQKRVDHVIEEVAAVSDRDLLLWLDGNPEDPTLCALAEQKLGARARITHVPSAQVGELYRLADLFVLGSLEESFGLAAVEAMMCGLPVLTHDGAHFQWLVGNPDCLLDMTRKGALAKRIADLAARPAELARIAAENRERALRRFDWANLKAGYVEMFRRVAAQASS